MKKLSNLFLALFLCVSMTGCATNNNTSETNEPSETAPTAVNEETATTVVVGAGGAGMMTAIELTQGGQDVILLEKMPNAGGATLLAATYFVAVDTQLQKDADMAVSVDDYVADQVSKNPDFNGELFTKLLNSSEESLQWLNDRGADLTRAMSSYQIGIGDGSSLGARLVDILKKECETVGVDLRTKTQVTEILMDNGKAVGVKATGPEGEVVIHAQNVVLATGGYAASADMVSEFAPTWVGTPSTTAAGCTGDGHRLASAVGANLTHMDTVRMNPAVYTADNGASYSLSVARAEGGILVNEEGKRFCNDYYPDYTQLSQWMIEQEGDNIYIVFDQKSVDTSARLAKFKDQGFLVEAPTLEELAEKINVPAESLVETVQRYQTFVDNGVDEDFGRDKNMNTRIDQAPYYAVAVKPGIQVTLGGIDVNNELQVLTADGNSIEGLYAIGECADDGLFGAAPTAIDITLGRMLGQQLLGK